MCRGIFTYCAYDPGIENPISLLGILSQSVGAPCLQKVQVPHGDELDATRRSPALNLFTPSPTSETTPQNSCPIVIGGLISGGPLMKLFLSVPQIFDARTLTTTSPFSGRGGSAFSSLRPLGPQYPAANIDGTRHCPNWVI